MYTTTYLGGNSPQEIAGCRLVASWYNDRYEPGRKRFERQAEIPHNYLFLIADQYQQGYSLIAINRGWILAGITDLIQENKLDPRVQIFRYGDIYLIFNYFRDYPIGFSGVSLVLSHMYYWQRKSTFGTTGLTEPEIQDLIYLYPVTTDTLADVTIFRSDILTPFQIESVISERRMTYFLIGLDPLKARKAALQTMEVYNFTVPITFEENTLSIWFTGYLHAEEIQTEFLDQYGKIPPHIPEYGYRPVFVNGQWFCERAESVESVPEDLFGLAISNMDRLRNLLQDVGYSVTPPDSLSLNCEVGYTTFEVLDQIYTLYSLNSTYGKRIDLALVSGPMTEEFHQQITEVVNTGAMFPWSMYAICSAYPNFIPAMDSLAQIIPN